MSQSLKTDFEIKRLLHKRRSRILECCKFVRFLQLLNVSRISPGM